jgi:hypothetical protein
MQKITCFLPSFNEQTISSLRESPFMDEIHVIENLQSTQAIKQIAELANSDFCLIYTKHTPLALGQFALERLVQAAEDTAAGLTYADFYQLTDGTRKTIPTIDYQTGSVRDDFNFGSVLFYNTKALKEAAKAMTGDYKFAGLYDLRLRVSQKHSIFHLNEFLYTEIEEDSRKSGEKQFDYVNPRNREVQVEMEHACTAHLRAIGAFLEPSFKTPDIESGSFAVEASVIIPVYNRVKTIGDAIQSVLIQKTDFPFNVIIIDNHSTDGTSEAIEKFIPEDVPIIHLVPERTDLGIGGCWNEGIHSKHCGRFAIQLDSDDVYACENTLQHIVDTFYRERCAMVVGSYTMTDFAMNTISPGVIDHREWTPENGRNNALRINGLGAPRAFFTPVLREINLPNTSYGEDYALGLRISREYQIGRIYESIYLCRRWNENSDTALDITKINSYNLYKDKLRTMEILARKKQCLY